MSVEIITFKKLSLFPVYLASFFFSSTPLDEQCSNLTLDNPNLKNLSQNSPERRREKQRLARRKHWNRMQAADLPRPDAPSRTQTIFGNLKSSIAQESVKKSLSKLNVWKAVGPDGIPNRVLKECAATLAEPLTFIFNCSLMSGLFSIQWKQGVIKPLFKNKGARSDPSCYRPVVLLPCVSKVFEGFVLEQLQEHCMRIGVLPDEQYGFLPKRSTLWQILSQVVDDWERAIDPGSTIHACFPDVAKAFDRVDHTLLEHTLPTVGVQAKELSWFVSYLNQRSICTSIDGCKSSFKPISSGVPKVPFWALCFLLPLSLHTCSFQASPVDLEIHRVSPCPCRAVLFPWRGQLLILVFWSQALSHGQTTWATSFDGSSSKLFLLKRLARRHRSANLVKRLYCCLARPVFEYAAPVWDACSQHDTIAMERFHLSIARAILHVRHRQTHSFDVLATIGWPTLAWPSPKTVFAVGPSARRWWQVPPLWAANFFRLCLIVALTLSAILWRYLFRRVVLPAIWSLFFLLLLLCLLLCLSLLFVAPQSAHFCKLLISFFFLISFLTVFHRSQLFSHTFFPWGKLSCWS